MPNNNDFTQWLLRELETRGWSMRELSRRSQIPPSTLSAILSGQMQVTPETIGKLAPALNMPLERLYRLAGFLPAPLADENERHALLDYFQCLSSDERRSVITLARALYESRGKYTIEK